MDTRSNYHQSLKDLKQDLLDMGLKVENQIHNAVDSLRNLDEKKARALVEFDDTIDEMMLNIEERCLRLIALQQPMAVDLRAIGMAIKMAIDLERIADHAVDIAKITIRLSGEELVKPLEDIPEMAGLCKYMLRECMLAYTEGDVHRAAALAEKDDEVDRIYSAINQEIISLLGNNANTNRQLTQLMMAAHFLERVADHATNIGEGVIYMVTGKRKDLNM